MDSRSIPRWDSRRTGNPAVLLQAKKIASIEDASPLVVAALHRFLLAVLYRALEGADRAAEQSTCSVVAPVGTVPRSSWMTPSSIAVTLPSRRRPRCRS